MVASFAFKRRWLQSIAAAIVCWRSGTVRAPDASTRNRSLRLTSSSRSDMRSSLAAAISMARGRRWSRIIRSEEHTSELQSPDTISYAVFCLKKKKTLKGHRPPARQFDRHHVRVQGLLRRFRHYFFNDAATTEIYTVSDTLSLHDALPISVVAYH